MQKINLVDVGARGGIDPRWLPHRDKISVTAFEPDAVECERLRLEQRDYPLKLLPVALGAHNNERATLYMTQAHGCWSTLKPNIELCRRYAFGPGMTIVGQYDITLQRMDSVLSVQPDVMKIDTQGTELHVLQGAGSLLDSCLAVETEVEFDHQYINQPLFADVDAFMRSRGFELHGLRLSYWRLAGDHGSAAGGKLMHGDALYFRPEIGESAKGRIILAAYRQHDMLAHHGARDLIQPPSRWKTAIGRLFHHRKLRSWVDSLRPPTAADWHGPEFF